MLNEWMKCECNVVSMKIRLNVFVRLTTYDLLKTVIE